MAKQIAHEHNSNAALVEALEKARKVLEAMPSTGDIVHAVCAIDAALALAKGE